MSEDPILDEIHRVREALAARFGHDLEVIGSVLEAEGATVRVAEVAVDLGQPPHAVGGVRQEA